MYRISEIVIPMILVLVLAAAGLWFFTGYMGKYLYYRDITTNGVDVGATLISKGIMEDGKLTNPSYSSASDRHHFILSYNLPDGAEVTCGLGVSKNTYDAVSKKDQLYVIYPLSNPENCTLSDSIELNKLLALSVLAISIFLILISLGLLFYIYSSFKKPAVPPELTTEMDLKEKHLGCPRCGGEMKEGYMPTVGGVSWRDRDEAVGIPTMLTGLPGTTFWIKRPMLHAFRCEDCGIITFRYIAKN